jgi:tetratricopeptide (TPR) repeat protein
LYREVLDLRDGQPDALFALAGIKLAQGDRVSAYGLYQEVLRRQPGNTLAAAAIFDLDGGRGRMLSASMLKQMLNDADDRGPIQFALGNYYAQQRRWSDAQQAYFEALRRDDQNPDYHYNLAVSLDHIGKRDVALEYYRSAVSLGGANDVQFDTAQVLRRIESLSAVN